MLRPNSTKWLTLTALLFGAICSSALMTFDGGWWTQKLFGYVPWALMPYALMLVVFLVSRLFHIHPSAQLALTWGVIIVSLTGPLLYIDTVFIHVDAQGGLVMLIIPVTQLVAVLVVIIAVLLLQWRSKQTAAKASEQTVGMIRMKKLIKFILATSVIGIALFNILISILQYKDRKSIDTAKEVDLYITQYCEANSRLPTSAHLHERFPDLSTDIGWFYFTDDKAWLKLQYPVRWRNGYAIGTPNISEFTATVYSYSINYHCGNAK
jgi:hypothetical protein